MELITSSDVTVDKKDVDPLLVEILDELLDDLLGKEVRKAFYDHMASDYHIGRDSFRDWRGYADLLLPVAPINHNRGVRGRVSLLVGARTHTEREKMFICR